jgi:peptidoglycan/LPS O-acetylase OafA/YrhL
LEHHISTSTIQPVSVVGQFTDINPGASVDPVSPFERRHDLDALRAIAMLLGIVLHAALSFAPIPWTVQDSRQSDSYFVLFSLIHGFRMPLFFMLSGFFTAMLWRKRGLASLVRHRMKRIVLPLVIGCFTIVPTMWIVGFVVSQSPPGSEESSELFEAVVDGEIDVVRAELEAPDTDVNMLDGNSGSSSLCTAVFLGRTEIAELLIDAGADVNLANRDRATPLHVAVFMGRSDEAALLLRAGADVEARDQNNLTPAELLTIDYGTTNFIASSLGVSVDQNALLAGRREIAGMMNESEYLGSSSAEDASINLEGLKGLLFQLPVFMHLWFLWFLCWLVAAFLLYAPLARIIKVQNIPRMIVCSPLGLLWLIPLTMLPQSFMTSGTFGPDTSNGLLPIPSVLFYYAIFFFFGAIYWDMHDTVGQLGRHWKVSLTVAILIVFPVALDMISGTFGLIPEIADQTTRNLITNFLQATFAWLMVYGSIGLFRRLLGSENKTMRYISDSSYWLYLVHLPLVLLAQWLVRDLPIPAIIKFTAITIAISVLLLLSYEYGVRYTIIGRILNGPRQRPAF